MKPGDKVRLKSKHSIGKKETSKVKSVDAKIVILDKPIKGRLNWPIGYLEVVPKKKATDVRQTKT